MANVYGFNSEEIARELKRQGEEGLQVNPSNMDATGSETIVVKCGEAVTPRTGDDVSGPFGGDVMYFGSGGLSLSDQLDNIEFYNITDSTYAEGDVITLTRWRRLWILNVATGGGGGGGELFQLQNAAEISAASGLTFGTGTAQLLEVNIGATAYEDAGVPSVTMINPFEEAVPSGSMITAYKKTVTLSLGSTDDRYVIVQISCPAETP